MMMPPSREICFNSSISNNDGLVANSISRREGISYESARSILDEETEELRTILKSEGEATIGNVGTLHCDENEKITFRQRYNSAGFSEMLGYYPISKFGEEQENTETRDDFSRLYRPDKYFYIAINKRFAKAAAMFICVLTICFSVFLPLSSDSRQQDFASVVPLTTVKVKKVIAEATQPITPTASKPAVKTGPSFVKTADCAGKSYLIVGSFKTKSECEAFLDQRSGDNNDIEIIEGKKIFMISATSSADRTEVVAAMNSDAVKSRFGQSWIWDAPI